MDNPAPPSPAPHSIGDLEIALDLARARYLLDCRAWRHLKLEFCGHPWEPLARLSGALADAAIDEFSDTLTPAHILRRTPKEHYEMLASLLQALGAGRG